ncbi:MAG: hypothetical protein WBP72_00340 [Rhodocyclaceae bacterium]
MTHCGVDSADVRALAAASQGAEIERGQPRLKGHQQSEQARQSTVALPERMNKDQFGVNLGQGSR